MSALSVADAIRRIRPQHIVAYVDVIRLWLEKPLTDYQYAYLKPHCPGGIRATIIPCPFDPRYRQLVYLFQPTCHALAYLASRPDVYLSFVEFSLDWTFQYPDQCDDAFILLDRHILKRY